MARNSVKWRVGCSYETVYCGNHCCVKNGPFCATNECALVEYERYSKEWKGMMTEFTTFLFASQVWLDIFRGDIFESLVYFCLVAWLKAFHLCKICGDPTFEPLFVLCMQ
jgi:hypothetical protein